MCIKKRFSLLILASVLFFGLPNAYADDGDQDGDQALVKVLCKVIGIAKGNTGKAISILVIISLAIGLFLGKVTWGIAIAVSVGMGVLFGAEGLVEMISDDKSNVCAQSGQ